MIHWRFNEAAGFTQRKLVGRRRRNNHQRQASMRPPVLPSGNGTSGIAVMDDGKLASMRPPVLPSGNPRPDRCRRSSPYRCFNEAAGFTQRKHTISTCTGRPATFHRFNEAAGFTQRKRARRVDQDHVRALASMRPPVLPSGNHVLPRHGQRRAQQRASMRPPVLPSGNTI